MNKFLISALSTFALSLAAFAMPTYWAAVETEGYEDAEGSGADDTASYSMYYCTVETANTLFKGTTVSDIQTYLDKSADNFDGVKAKATTYDSVAYSDGEYHILDYTGVAFSSANYVAIAFYGSEAYRVYGYDNASTASGQLTPNGQLVFNESYAASGTAGEWRQAVPEPTSALLLLLGAAGLALKRK